MTKTETRVGVVTAAAGKIGSAVVQALLAQRIVEQAGTPCSTRRVLAHALEDTVRHRDGSQRLPLPVGIGDVTFVNDVTDTKIRATLALQRELHEQRNRQYAKTCP